MSDLLHPTAGVWNMTIRDAPHIAFGDWIINPIEAPFQDLLQRYINLPIFPPNEINLPAYIAVGATSEGERSPQVAETLRQRFLTTLRLCRDGSVMTGRFWWTTPQATTFSPWDFIHITNLPNPVIYEVGSEDIPYLEAIHQIVLASDFSHAWLSTAVTRFHDSYTRATEQDAYVDLVIALEALCGDKGGDGNLKYKAAIRSAHLISAFEPVAPGKFSTKEEVFDLVKKAYDARSALVHGDKPKSNAPSIDDLRRVVRHAILAAVRLVQAAPLGKPKYKSLALQIDYELVLM